MRTQTSPVHWTSTSPIPGPVHLLNGLYDLKKIISPSLLDVSSSELADAVARCIVEHARTGEGPALTKARRLRRWGFALCRPDSLVTRLQSDQTGTGAWMTYGAVAVDLFTDGLLIGAGSSVNRGLGLVLAVGQVTVDLPEGYAVIANLRERGIPRRQRIWLSAAFLLPALGAAMVAYLLLRGQPPEWKLGVLMVGAGLLTVAAIEDMIGGFLPVSVHDYLRNHPIMCAEPR
ncbi:MAG: hypothetical protein RIB46_06175 [Pseudomonadales bacterium]